MENCCWYSYHKSTYRIKNGIILKNKISENKLIVKKENKKGEIQIEIFYSFVFLIILFSHLISVNSWHNIKSKIIENNDKINDIKDFQ